MNKQPGLAVFETAIGKCALTWGTRGLRSVHLPAANEVALRRSISRTHPDAQESVPAGAAITAIDGIRSLLEGKPVSLRKLTLDMEGVSPFRQRVYQRARQIDPGKTMTYGELAEALEAWGAARAVGTAMATNPFPLIVPCHRVLAAGERIGGFSAHGGVVTKLRLLGMEYRSALPRPRPSFNVEEATARLAMQDPRFKPLIENSPPCDLAREPGAEIFNALVRAIIYQQLSGRAAATIHARMCALFPRPHLAPTPLQLARIDPGRLRAAGVSAGKQLALKALARAALKGDVPTAAEAQQMTDEALIDEPTALHGIGRWTVEMLLMFKLGRPDVLPLDDLGIRKGYAVLSKGKLPDRATLAAAGEQWRPYRSVASWYLWRAADTATP